MEVQGKVWGETSMLLRKNGVEVHRIACLKGGYSSKHRHIKRWSKFFVEQGTLLVRVWKGYGLIDETQLGPGMSTAVAPGEWHQFEVLDHHTVAFEFYWVDADSEDIEREGRGGVKGEETDAVTERNT